MIENIKSMTKKEIKALRLKCPFCGQDLIFIEDDWTDMEELGGEWHSVRDLVFEHELDHLDDKPSVKSGCQGGGVSYCFIESKDDSERQAQPCPMCGDYDLKWTKKTGLFRCNYCGHKEVKELRDDVKDKNAGVRGVEFDKLDLDLSKSPAEILGDDKK